MKPRKPRKPREVQLCWIESSEWSETVMFEDIHYGQWKNRYDLDGWVEMFYSMNFSDTVHYKFVMVF
jgi:hypothetical protein